VDRSNFKDLEIKKKHEAEELADLTISLTGQLLRVTGASYIEQCRLRIGELHLLLLQPTSLGPVMSVTGADIGSAISKVLSENIAMAERETPPLLFFRFVKPSDWDWSELELIFGPLKSFDPSNIRDLKYACSSRIFLRKLHPQVKE
jgi:hypothetical protein